MRSGCQRCGDENDAHFRFKSSRESCVELERVAGATPSRRPASSSALAQCAAQWTTLSAVCTHTHTNTSIHEESSVLRILIFLFFKLWFGRTELYAGKTAGESTRLHLRDNIISRLNWKPVCFLLRTPLVDGARTGSTSLRITEIVLCVIWIQPPCPTAGRRKFEAAAEVSRQMVGMFR